MRPGRIGALALLAAMAVLAFGASTASPGTTAPQQTLRPSAAAPVKVNVRYTIKKFVRQGNRLVAQGTAIAKYAAPSGAVKTLRFVRSSLLVTGGYSPAAAI